MPRVDPPRSYGRDAGTLSPPRTMIVAGIPTVKIAVWAAGRTCRGSSAVQLFEHLGNALKDGERKERASGEDQEHRGGNGIDELRWVLVSRVVEQNGEEYAGATADHGRPDQNQRNSAHGSNLSTRHSRPIENNSRRIAAGPTMGGVR